MTAALKNGSVPAYAWLSHMTEPMSAWARGIVAGAKDAIASRAVAMIAIFIVFMAERETESSFELRALYPHDRRNSCISILDICDSSHNLEPIES